MSEVGKECRKSARPKYINPMIDGGFKILFGSERSKELTESLLSAILGFEVAEVTFLNTEALPAALDEKPVRYDILCEDREGGRYLLEMQVKGHAGLLQGLSHGECRGYERKGRRNPTDFHKFTEICQRGGRMLHDDGKMAL